MSKIDRKTKTGQNPTLKGAYHVKMNAQSPSFNCACVYRAPGGLSLWLSFKESRKKDQ